MQAPTYKGEVMLLRWADSSTGGRTVTFTLEDTPDDPERHPFKGLPCGKDGQRFALVVVPIAPNEHPDFTAEVDTGYVRPITLEPVVERRSWSSLSYSQRSGILRNDERFQQWLGVNSPDEAADIIRRKCGVESCTKIDGYHLAEEKFINLVAAYKKATGQETWHP